jgi:hypothetical protein
MIASMSLTHDDLAQIRSLFEEYVSPLQGEIEVLRNDIREIYDMITRLERHSVRFDASFERLPDEEQILQLHAAVLALAKRKGVTLPQ